MAMLLVRALVHMNCTVSCVLSSGSRLAASQRFQRQSAHQGALGDHTDVHLKCAHPGVQAEEEGRVPAAAPSKAALKRARKKAAAAQAAAAAATVSRETAGTVAGPPSPNAAHDPAPAVAASAGSQHTSGLSGRARASLHAGGDSMTAVQSGLQGLRLQSGGAASASPAVSRSIPGWTLCPLTRAVMVDPVLCTGDGQTYERSAITQWLAVSDTSPVTGQPLASQEILPNHALRSIIQAAQTRSSRAGGGPAVG
jgi:U-box domain